MAGITLAQAEAQLAVWIAADAAVASGQEYEIAGRRLKRANAAEITGKIEYWNALVQSLSLSADGRSRSRTMRVR
jgi:hypothetical protein